MLHLVKGPVQGHITEDRRRKKRSTWRKSKLQTFCFKGCAVLLGYNRFPSTTYFLLKCIFLIVVAFLKHVTVNSWDFFL